MKVAEAIPGFYNGMSQQPPSIRLPTQCEYQENAVSSLVNGLTKRPNTEYVANLLSDVTDCFTHLIHRDAEEKYVVIFLPDSSAPIRVFTLDGTECTVRYGSLDDDLNFTEDDELKLYAYTSTPGTDIKACTIADYTIIVNTNITTIMASDTYSGTLTGSVQSFTKLPNSDSDTVPVAGDLYEVAGDEDSAFLGYYVKYDGSVWREVPKPGVLLGFDSGSMPHRLVRTGTNEFTFAGITWDAREAGDDDTVPIPSFIDNTISNVIFFRGRLCFFSNDNIIFSKAGDYFDFFCTTATDSLDDDPIDIAAATRQVSYLRNAVPFNKELLVFSDSQQFILSTGDSLLTPTSVALTESTAYEFKSDSDPVSAGSNCYFISPKVRDTSGTGASEYVSVREYYVDPDSLTDEAADVTSHVPELIPHGYIKLVSCNSMDMVFVNSDAEPASLYAYSYYWQGTEKVQSAWGKWTFGGDIVGMAPIGNTLYLLISYDDVLCLEKMRLEKVTHGDLDYRVHLDRLTSLTGEYDEDADTTTWTLPYAESGDVVVIDPDTGLEVQNVDRPTTTTVTYSGDKSSKSYLIGTPYTMVFTLSRWYVRDSKSSAIINGKLSYSSLLLAINDTGYFTVTVSSEGRDDTTQDFNAKVVGKSSINTTPLASGIEKFSVRGSTKNLTITIENDSHLPSEFQTGSFEGLYVNNNKVL